MKKFILFGLVFSMLSLVSAQPLGNFENCPMGGMMYGGYGSGAAIFSWAFGLLVIVALVLLIIWLAKQIQKKK